MHTDDDYARLAEAVFRRRNDLDLTQMEIAQEGGLSLDRVSAVERGEARNLRPKTIRSLERGVRWRQGSVKAILNGATDGEPDDQPPPRVRRSVMDEAEALMDENERRAADLIRRWRRLDEEGKRTVADLIEWMEKKTEERSRHGDQNR